MNATRRARLADAGTYLAYFVICLFFAGPLLWIFSLSIRTAAEVYVSDIRIWPRMPTLQNYREALDSGGFKSAFLNSLAVAIPSTIIPITIAAFAAYAFSWMEFRGRHAMFVLVVGLMVVPLQMALIPILRLYTEGATVGGTRIFPDLALNGTFLGMFERAGKAVGII
jgi:alpha-glucoside transport system permease protein